MENKSANKMGTMPIGKLLISLSVPMMASMLVQALYNVVDSIFVARLSENALTSVTLAFPMQTLMISLGSGTSVGVNAMLSQSLGEKHYDNANKAANNGIFLAIMSYLVFLIIGVFVASPFIRSQATNPEIIDGGITYLQICCNLSIGVMLQITCERLLQSTGLSIYSMITQMSGAVCNIILDPILIFGLFGAPRLGIAGAAYATVFGQILGASLAIFFNLKKNTDIKISIKDILHPDFGTIKRIYFVGIPSILMMAIGSVMTYFMNLILSTFETTATAVFGAYFKIQSFFFMPIFGLNNGLIPIIAYNYGARNRGRIMEAFKKAVGISFTIMMIGTIVMHLFPAALLSLFSASTRMLEIGKPALRIISLSFPLASIAIICGSVFQALSQSYYSLIVSAARQLLVLIPVAWLLSRTGQLNLVWASFPIAELVSIALSLYFMKRVHKLSLMTLDQDLVR